MRVSVVRKSHNSELESAKPRSQFWFSQDSHRYSCDCSRCAAVGVALLLHCSPPLLRCGGSEAAPLGTQNTKIINTHVRMNELQILPKQLRKRSLWIWSFDAWFIVSDSCYFSITAGSSLERKGHSLVMTEISACCENIALLLGIFLENVNS